MLLTGVLMKKILKVVKYYAMIKLLIVRQKEVKNFQYFLI